MMHKTCYLMIIIVLSLLCSGSRNLLHSMDADDTTGFVVLTDVVPDVILEMRYYSTFNFIGTRVDGYEAPIALCTHEAAKALAKANELLRAQGYRLKVFDAYRPQCAVNHFIRWAKDESDTAMQRYFYPDMPKNRLLSNYVSRRSGHTRGSTFDLTLFDERTGREVDMGGTFDFFGVCSHNTYINLSEAQRKNRRILREAMMDAGFRSLPHEWWHYTLNGEPYKNMYFVFPVYMF